MPRSYDLPSLGDLSCFEATARHLSFKDAAAELNVTPAAVSHRIKSLEQDLGQPMFTRKFRGVELTQAGALLFVAIQRGFETISECVQRIRYRQDESGVTITATPAISGLWLTQRLATFWGSNPEISISQIVQEAGSTTLSDLSIHYGNPDEAVGDIRILFQGCISALGTPIYKEKYGISGLSDLAKAPLVHAQSPDQSWTEWSDWLSETGASEASGPGYFLNNYLIALRTAENHVGAVLGWESLLQQHLESGRFVRLVPEVIPSPHPFYLRIHDDASRDARHFADWLVGATG
ncbi:LysR family transcriptional regulator [Celeribacter sp. ULVN23_4]